jgi:ATP-dependent helicase/nuclease subunit B
MTIFFKLDQALYEQLTDQQLLLTPNRRMARHIVAAFNQQQKNTGLAAWPAARVFAIEDWLQQRWQDLQDRGSTRMRWTLSAWQEQALWQEVIYKDNARNDDATTDRLLPVRQLAQQAASSYQLLQRFQLSPQRLSDDLPASAALKRWLLEFQRRCRALHTGSASNIAHELMLAWQENLLPIETKITLCGFHDVSPQYRALLKICSETLVEINPPQTQTAQQQQQQQQQRAQLPDSDSEILAFAHWARDILSQHLQLQRQHDEQSTALVLNHTALPLPRIGLIVPKLATQRTRIERLLRQVLEPHYLDPAEDASTPPLNFSAGVPLASTSLIFTALELLNLLQTEWPLQNLLYLLHSPFWSNGPEEDGARNNAEKLWRAEQQFSMARDHALHILSRQPDTDALQNKLRLASSLPLQLEKYCRPSQWQQTFSAMLDALQWPGARRLNSLEFQQAEQWQQCLQTLASLDSVITSCSANTALQWLRDIASQHNFQAQSAASPIQVLGVLEASGLHFSHLWLSGMSRTQWPPAPAPDPLLPLALQRQHNMPHASQEREYFYARTLSEQFSANAEQLVCSFARHEADGEHSISELWRHLPETDADHFFACSSNMVEQTALETIDIAHAPAVDPTETIKGGFNILKKQISNPFNAFAKFRLGVDTLKEPTLGITAIERGNLLHTVLEHFWQQITSRQQLVALDSDTQHDLLTNIIARASDKILQKRPGLRHALNIEKQRLSRVLQQWLAVERERADFTVAALEQQIPLQLAGLDLQLRIDRIDTLQNGDHLLIDYKSSASALKRSHWLSESADDAPMEPQLPLYATQYPHTAGIAWAQIHTRKTAWTAIGKQADIPGLQSKKNDWQQSPTAWQQLLAHWQLSLAQVAQDFMEGKTTVTATGETDRAWLALSRAAEMASMQEDKNTPAYKKITAKTGEAT